MSRKTIAETLKSQDADLEQNENTKKRSSANRKRLTIGSAKQNKAKVPKITRVFKNTEKIENPKIKAITIEEEVGGDDDDFSEAKKLAKPKKRELVTRKGILGLNLVSTADLNRQAALDDDTIEERGSKRYRVNEDGVKIKMKKVTKRRASKSKGKK